jgi:hypothetical protein
VKSNHSEEQNQSKNRAKQSEESNDGVYETLFRCERNAQQNSPKTQHRHTEKKHLKPKSAGVPWPFLLVTQMKHIELSGKNWLVQYEEVN